MSVSATPRVDVWFIPNERTKTITLAFRVDETRNPKGSENPIIDLEYYLKHYREGEPHIKTRIHELEPAIREIGHDIRIRIEREIGRRAIGEKIIFEKTAVHPTRGTLECKITVNSKAASETEYKSVVNIVEEALKSHKDFMAILEPPSERIDLIKYEPKKETGPFMDGNTQ